MQFANKLSIENLKDFVSKNLTPYGNSFIYSRDRNGVVITVIKGQKSIFKVHFSDFKCEIEDLAKGYLGYLSGEEKKKIAKAYPLYMTEIFGNDYRQSYIAHIREKKKKMHNNASNYINSESYIGNIALFLKDALEYMQESSNTIDKSLQ